MKERGKALEAFGNDFAEFNYSAASEMPCKKHPNSSSVGICAYCLKDRLVKLVCSECGEQRLSSCSCSDVSSSYRNSCSTMEVGSVGRVSFLIENEKIESQQNNNNNNNNPSSKSRRGEEKSEQVIFLRRSNSSCVEVKKSNGFWKIKRLFRKKRNKGCEKNGEFCDEKSEIWVPDIMGVSRSRSLCSFRNGGHNDLDEGSEYAFSSAKISDVTSGIFLDSESEPRKSGFRGVFDAENGFDFKGPKRGFAQNIIELDRVHSVPNRSVFPAKESDFSAMDESAFIDLKLDLSSESKQEFSAARISGASDYKSESFEPGVSLGGSKNHGLFGNGGGSCRITVNERGLKRGSKSHKVWKWIFKYPPANKKEKDNVLRS
ncbi:hypothetical protein CDL12_01336 [Handroanthus impetiginosus]|uniref:Uncharacterized protein n=1 Tax=Handroanthus impetiginosus TaxID=429701 RepID=A0A2G9I846_9LAMI|nr:hypothetical protein CDL12_01336 [Handroanthus impetiginosus]